jgi:hypothetical protein
MDFGAYLIAARQEFPLCLIAQIEKSHVNYISLKKLSGATIKATPDSQPLFEIILSN